MGPAAATPSPSPSPKGRSRRATAWPELTAAVALSICGIASGCATTTESRYVAAGDGVLCDGTPGHVQLGTVAVLPETAWRSDQKDRAERVAMAERAIAEGVAGLPCGSLDAPGGVRAFEVWSSHPESAVLDALAREGVDTAVIVRVEELTPRVLVTLSVPFLWSSASEADFRVRVLRTADGEVLDDFRVKRVRAGPFHLRPASWAESELRRGLSQSLSPARADPLPSADST